MRENLKSKVTTGILWGGLNNGSQQILNLVIGIFLARLLTPADYGMVGVLTIFSALAGAMQEGGFISALTNKKHTTHADYNSVFWFSLTCGITLYLILFFLAPLIARFYNLPSLTSLARFIFLGFLFSSMNIAPRAILFKNLRVKQNSLVTLISLAISGLVGVYLAYSGAAYWGLAAQTVTYTFSVTFFSFYFTGWKPSLKITLKPAKEMLGYGSRLVATNIFTTLNNNIFAVLLGKFYTAADVGAFNQASKWNGMGYSTISGMMNNVAQPAMTQVTDNPQRIVQVFRKLLRFTAFVSFPLMLGLALVAHEFIIIAIGEKWVFSATILQLLCLWGGFYPISHLMGNLLLSQGRSGAYMWNTIILALIQIMAVYFTYPYGLYQMLYVFIAINIAWVAVWYYISCRHIQLGSFQFAKDILPFFLIAVVAFLVAFFICTAITNLYAAFFAKIAIMASVYLGLLWVMRARILKESLEYLKNRIKF